jgi:hypothetical protein
VRDHNLYRFDNFLLVFTEEEVRKVCNDFFLCRGLCASRIKFTRSTMYSLDMVASYDCLRCFTAVKFDESKISQHPDNLDSLAGSFTT